MNTRYFLPTVAIILFISPPVWASSSSFDQTDGGNSADLGLMAQSLPNLSNEAISPSKQMISVKALEITGSTLFRLEDLDRIAQPIINKPATVEDLNSIADAITQLYVERGYITSRAILIPQTVTDGVVEIRVIEGGLEGIEVEGIKRVSRNYIIDRISLSELNPLNKESLDDALKLLRADPLFENFEASLRPGKEAGQSVLVVRVIEANPLSAGISVDNYYPPSVGAEQFGVGASYRNLIWGSGDRLAVSYNRSFSGGSNVFDFSYQIPLNAMNGTLQLRYSPSNFRITDPEFSTLNIRGGSDLYEINFRQPFVRSPREEHALSLGFAYQNGQTFLFENLPTPFGIGPDANGGSRTSVLKFGQDYTNRDPSGAWALRSQFNFGLGIFNATTNPDPIPDGLFFSWSAQLQRVQQLNDDNLLILQSDIQLTPNTLLPAQQFTIGGGQLLRGFRQNARSGDNGIRFSIENRIALQRDESGTPVLQLAPFIDLGKVWNIIGNPNLLPSQTFLAGGGLGLLWEPLRRLNVRLDYALPFISLSDRRNNLQDAAFYFSVNYRP
ncbi:MAG: ShlB/FhaC/HecB family hemolysin secretion/activation protein [bacterium]|nr:ShlB/FhaC/HecB family hemolysin secretion/activation protein [bacterium]